MRHVAPWSAAAALLAACMAGEDARAYAVARQQAEEAVDWSAPVLLHGGWVPDGTRLRRQRTKWRRSFVIAPAHSTGFARLRLSKAAKADVAVLFRVEPVADHPVKLRGYGLSVNMQRGTVGFLRWDAGGVRDPGAGERLEALAGATDVEVLLWAVGPNFAALVLDGTSKETLGALSWSDSTYADGYVGMYALGDTALGAEVELTVVAESPPEQRADATPPWLGQQWVAYVTPAQAGAIPAPLSALFEQRTSAASERVALITSEHGIVALRELGIEPLASQAGVPYRLRQRAASALTDWRGTHEALRQLAQRHPERTLLESIGQSAEGRPLLALRLADDPTDRRRPAVLLCAAHHANEAGTPAYPLDAAAYLLEHASEPQVARWMAALAVVIVPMVNPDGSEAFWHIDDQFGRKNRRRVGESTANAGVDLNRNYPFAWGGDETRYNTGEPASDFYRGPAPASEPEVRAMMALANRDRFVATISYHEAAGRILVPYTIPGVANPDPSTAWTMADEMVARLPHAFAGRRYAAVRSLYRVRGTEQDWYHHELGSMAYLIEVPYRRPADDRLREAVVHSRPAWMYLLDRWIDGPSLSVHTVEARTGEPVAAEIAIAEIAFNAQEHWTSSPHSGWFHHYLPGRGRYTIEARHQALAAVRHIEAGSGTTVVHMEMKPAAELLICEGESDVAAAAQ